MRKVKPDLILYFTDEIADEIVDDLLLVEDELVTAKKPPIPVIWCLYGDGDRTVSWGKSIVIDYQE